MRTGNKKLFDICVLFLTFDRYEKEYTQKKNTETVFKQNGLSKNFCPINYTTETWFSVIPCTAATKQKQYEEKLARYFFLV